jgi:type IV secretion system protein VirB1
MMPKLFEQRWALVLAAGTALVSCGLPGSARATPLSSDAFMVLAARCAPSVSPKTLQAVAETESGLDPWAVNDNTSGISERPDSEEKAATDAENWIAHGDSVDLGLMQINSGNLSALNITEEEAFDPCQSLAGGAAVLQAAFGADKVGPDQQVALLLALSRYNTGSPLKGIMNGYSRKVMENLQPNPVSAAPENELVAPATDPNAPPSWDVWASANYEATHGAAWIVSFPSAPSPPAEEKTPVGQPALAPATQTAVANTQAKSITQPTTRSQ